MTKRSGLKNPRSIARAQEKHKSRKSISNVEQHQLAAMTQSSNQHEGQPASAAMPPAMAAAKSRSVEEQLAEMNQMPLFMTTLDETDGGGGENIALEALKAMAYEGTRSEVAENFRQQGNECARAKQWADAKEFYDKAIAALSGPQNSLGPDVDETPIVEAKLDEAEEAKKEKAIEEACYVNRALCNLEKSEWSRLPRFSPYWSRIGKSSRHG